MKITVEVELAESEIGNAQRIKQLFAGISDNVITRVAGSPDKLSAILIEAMASKKSDVALEELTKRLSTPELHDECFSVICEILFSTDRVDRVEPVMPWMLLLAKVPEPARTHTREEILRRTIDFLSQPRKADAPRGPLLPYGEVMGGLIRTEAFSARGALAAVMQLIRTESTRVAGITALGKMVEIAFDQLERADAQLLDALRSTLSAAQEDNFLYDIEYISEPFGWSQQPPNPRFLSIMQQRSCRYHNSPILAMAYATTGTREVVVTSSGDGVVATWDGAGNRIENCQLARHFACCLDLPYRGQALLLGGIGRGPNIPPAIVFYREELGQWQERGAVEPDGARLITAVRSIRSPSSSLLFSCAVHSSISSVLYYDVARPAPLREFHDHSDVITVLHAPPDRDQTLVSGSRDSTLVLYDLRQGGTQTIGQHFNTVTGIASFGECIVSAGLDKRLIVTDLRMMQPLLQRDLESAILSISVGIGRQCAVATMTGLSVIDLNSNMMSAVCKAEAAAGIRYHSTQWNAAQTLLYCGGDTANLDIYAIQVC